MYPSLGYFTTYKKFQELGSLGKALFVEVFLAHFSLGST